MSPQAELSGIRNSNMLFNVGVRSSMAVDLASPDLAGNTEKWQTVKISQTCIGAFPTRVTVVKSRWLRSWSARPVHLRPEKAKHFWWRRMEFLFQSHGAIPPQSWHESTRTSDMTELIAVPQQDINTSLGARRKIGVVVVDHHPKKCLNEMAIVCCLIDGDACTDGGRVFGACRMR